MAEAAQLDDPYQVDYLSPNHAAIYAKRAQLLQKLRADNQLLRAAKIHYTHNPWDMVRDWGMTFDPRALDMQLQPQMPFVPWPRQVEYLKWLSWMWKNQHRGQVEKSRDCGVTWLTVAWACANFCNIPGFVAGFGSRKTDQVDKTGDPRSIFWMIRFFMSYLPPELLPEGYDPRIHNAYMRVNSPESKAAITGEGGDQIGRGGRTSIYFLDEAAFVEHQDEADAALSANTNTQINISTFNGPGNRFQLQNQELRKKAPEKLFIFDWRDDPRKDEAWAEKKQDELNDPVIWAQEYERDPYASMTDAFIPARYVRACIDAHLELGIHPSGIRAAGFDPADVGDAKGYVARHGSIIFDAEQLTHGDITQAIPWAFTKAQQQRVSLCGYDADGMGAPSIKLSMTKALVGAVKVVAFYGSGAVDKPDEPFVGSRDSDLPDEIKTNQQAFTNRRAQAWYNLLIRAKNTFDAIEAKKAGRVINFDPDNMLSISSECKDVEQLRSELSMPKRVFSNRQGKIQVESKDSMRRRGVQSPNLGDAAVIAFDQRMPDPGVARPLQKGSRRQRDRGAGY